MFRENVLIALTILISILIVSFVIVMTLFIQIYELDQRITSEEKVAEFRNASKLELMVKREEIENIWRHHQKSPNKEVTSTVTQPEGSTSPKPSFQIPFYVKFLFWIRTPLKF